MQALNGVPTAANFPLWSGMGGGSGCQLGPNPTAFHLDLVVGNAAALVRLATVMDAVSGPLGGYQLSDPFVMVGGSGQVKEASWDNCVGFQAADFIQGTHATVYASLYERGDPSPVGGNAYAATLSASGANSVVSGLSLITDVVTAASATTVTFASIPQSFTSLKVVYSVASQGGGLIDQLNCQINQDTSANYYTLESNADAASAFTSIMSGPISDLHIASCPGAGSPGGDVWNSGEALFPNYTTAHTKPMVSVFYNPYNLGTGQKIGHNGGSHQVDAAISRLDFFLGVGSNAFVNGSRITLYGIQ